MDPGSNCNDHLENTITMENADSSYRVVATLSGCYA
jgi:hypothetical protein